MKVKTVYCGMREYGSLIIPQKLEIIRMLKMVKFEGSFGFIQHRIVSCLSHKETYVASGSMMDLLRQQTFKELKLAQLDKVLFKLFGAVQSKGKP
jgi:hypothetical protein